MISNLFEHGVNLGFAVSVESQLVDIVLCVCQSYLESW
jgi:hypothetical protein